MLCCFWIFELFNFMNALTVNISATLLGWFDSALWNGKFPSKNQFATDSSSPPFSVWLKTGNILSLGAWRTVTPFSARSKWNYFLKYQVKFIYKQWSIPEPPFQIIFHAPYCSGFICDPWSNYLSFSTVGSSAVYSFPPDFMLLTTMQLHALESSRAVDAISFYLWAVGSCDTYQIPLGSVTLTGVQLWSPELFPAIDVIPL